MVFQKVKELVTYAFEHSNGWKSRLESASVTPTSIQSMDDFNKIPVLKKDQLPTIQGNDLPFGGLSTVSANQMARIFVSPGPIYDPQTNDGDHWRFSEALKAAGFNENDIVQNTFSYHFSPAGFMFDSALRKLGSTVIPAGVGNTDIQIKTMRELGVTGYVGTPSYFATLLEAARENGWELGKDINVKKVFFTGEMLPNDLRSTFEENGISVFEGYGTADAGCIAYQDTNTKSDNGLKVTDSAFVQICDPNTGIPLEEGDGEIVVTIFDQSYPLLRFGTGDLSRWVEGFEGKRIAGVLGRVSDGIKVKGMFVREKELINVMSKEPVASYQAIITREGHLDQFTLYVETSNQSELEGLDTRVQNVLRLRPTIVSVEPGKIDKDEKKLIDKRKWN